LVECESLGFGTASIWAYHALGLLELGLGHPVAAAAHLDHLDAIATANDIVDPNAVWWQADHVEALVRSGRRHEAARALKRLVSGADLSGGVWPSATALRCHALLATTIDDAERSFEQSLSEHDRLAAPFELARTLLCRAERRVSAGAHLDPSADLSEAIAIFDALGAASWSAQGRALRDTIASVGEATTVELLTPAERRVAEAVASGMSNREVAASLYISERTVEFHLHNVYRKLSVRSRTQLVRRLPPR
jgi:DNA-binding CsgD family transcriptional regulator